MTVPSWRGIASRVDLLRSTGPRHAWRRYRQDLALRPVLAGRGERLVRTLWADAARELGATVTELGSSRFEIRLGQTSTTIDGQTTALNSQEAVVRAADKPAVYGLLSRAGLPVPEHLAFRSGDARAARTFLERSPVPCFVKPGDGSGGEGITGEIRNPGELRRATLSASRFASRLLIEREVPGDVFRLLVLDGRVLDVVRRLRPRITGDGRSTVEELVLGEYDRRLGENGAVALKPFVVDLDCILTLQNAGLSLRSVLPAGTTVTVKTVTNWNRPEENMALGTAVAKELGADAVAAACAVGLRLAGVDVIAPTANAGLAASGGVVVDVNAVPALHHHALVANGGATARVAVPILRALLENAGPAASDDC